MSFTLDLRFFLDTITDEFPRDRRRESGAQRSLESAEILYFLTTDGERHSGTCPFIPYDNTTVRKHEVGVIEKCPYWIGLSLSSISS